MLYLHEEYGLKRVKGLAASTTSCCRVSDFHRGNLTFLQLFHFVFPSHKMNQFRDYAGCSTMGFIQFLAELFQFDHCGFGGLQMKL